MVCVNLLSVIAIVLEICLKNMLTIRLNLLLAFCAHFYFHLLLN